MANMTKKTASSIAMLNKAGIDTNKVRINLRIPLAALTTRNTRNTRKTRTILRSVGETDSEIKLSKMNPSF